MLRKTILINSSHFKGGNTYSYRFLTPQTFSKGDKISFQSFSIYNQTPNIRPEYNNNTFSIKWLGQIYNFTIPTGYYSANDLNNFVQFCLLNNGLYVLTSSGSPYYFINILANQIQYAGQFNIIAIPSLTQATALKYTLPSFTNGITPWSFPDVAQTPQITLSIGLGKILGFTNLTLPSSPSQTNISVLSQVTPVLSPVNLYTVTCNLLNSNYSIFPELFFQVSLGGVGYGNLVQLNAGSLSLIDIYPSRYSSIDINLYDQNNNPITIIDNDFSLVLYIDSN